MNGNLNYKINLLSHISLQIFQKYDEIYRLAKFSWLEVNRVNRPNDKVLF